ncbi:response regulator [Streptomyces sp. NPDC050485]|uniref:response regulator n=1 Tax=Streptomyces sp. NPDC050485 TaxID=3365617 RepID=UPI00378DDFF0
MEQQTRIAIADDHALLRGALADVLRLEERFEVVAEVSDGFEAVEAARELQPDIVLLDIEMPRNDPPVTVERIRDVSPRTEVIVLTMHDDDAALITALIEKGIKGFLHKGVTRQELVFAIKQVQEPSDHVTVFASRQAFLGRGPDDVEEEPAGEESPLSRRELQILTYVGVAFSNQQIANRLGITENTVKRHLRNIFQKMGANSRIDAYNKTVAAGLLQPVARQTPSS